MKQVLLYLLIPTLSFCQKFTPQETLRLENRSKDVTIIRDNWGIPHIYGKTDADAVFGLLYAQCEENFERVERNYIEMMGRLAELEGEHYIYDDLEMRLIYDSAAAIRDYKKSPAWFQKLLNAFADGVNYYLAKHPDVKPKLLTRFEPWFPLMYTDGSIAPTQTGGLTVQDVQNFYGPDGASGAAVRLRKEAEPATVSGSNGFAIAPSKTASKNAILYINPHVTFYFRSEVQMVSDEGLNAYGAVTWGQFFVYQGFNEHCGWMHTSSYADVADIYEEKVTKKGGVLSYRYNNSSKPVRSKQVIIKYKKDGTISILPVTAYYTHHGPVMGSKEGKWLSLKENNRSLNSLLQSWLRTKAKSFEEFKKVMDMRANNSNNTVYADDQGNIAYWHGNFMPKRDPKLDWSYPVDGTTAATEWKGLHSLNEIVHLYNPKSGWIQNCNSTPFTASGTSSPKKEEYPTYMAPDGQNARAINAIRLLQDEQDITLDKIISIGYNHYLAAFDILLPSLFKAYEDLAATDSLKQMLREPITLLQSWNKESAVTSVPATIAIEWGYKLGGKVPPGRRGGASSNVIGRLNSMTTSITPTEKLHLLAEVIKELTQNFGTWKIPWGDINRFQRNRGGVGEMFDDAKQSLPVGFASSLWGSLPAFESRQLSNVHKRYGVSGNSFIAAVEFGKKVKAKTVITGGQSSDPASEHFLDQAQMFTEGRFKDVLFYKEDVLKYVERTYHPGE